MGYFIPRLYLINLNPTAGPHFRPLTMNQDPFRVFVPAEKCAYTSQEGVYERRNAQFVTCSCNPTNVDIFSDSASPAIHHSEIPRCLVPKKIRRPFNIAFGMFISREMDRNTESCPFDDQTTV
jgi:hypothetical protein